MRHQLKDIGQRLTHVRGRTSQVLFATNVGLHKNTLGSYERGEREPGALALAGYARLGWNTNWLLTGEGPERLEALSGGASGVSEKPVDYKSQPVSHEDVKLAVQLLREAEGAVGGRFTWTPEQQAEATAILVRLLEIGMATAEVHSIAKQQIKLVSGGQQQDAGSRTKGVGG